METGEERRSRLARERARRWHLANWEHKRRANREWYAQSRSYVRAYAAESYAVRAGLIQRLREESVCFDCRDADAPLEYDHVPWRGKKRFDIGRAGNYSVDTLITEINKTELVCNPCHRWRGIARRMGYPLGTVRPTVHRN